MGEGVESSFGVACKSRVKRFGITTLGCKVNTFESEFISHTLSAAGWKAVGNREVADLCIINTCTVTGEADRQARQEVRRVIRRNPDALVVVTGCYAQMKPEACAKIPGVDLVLGNSRKLDIHRLLPDLEQRRLSKVMVGDLDQQVSLPDALVSGLHGHNRAFVQVQQGCSQGCTFCIIHRARGPNRSLPPELVRRQVQRLVFNGYKEVVVCGIDLGSYGDDLVDSGCQYGLAGLLADLLKTEGDFRIRLSSIDPAHIDDALIGSLQSDPRVCRHLHLSLQSGSTLILKRMKRRYSAEFVYDRVRILRRRVPELVLSADIMVGFPTETERQFRDTENMVCDLGIAFPHVFCYSERAGTPAARIPSQWQVPPAIRRQRAKRLRYKASLIRARLLRSRIGEVHRVLIEGGGTPPAGYQRARAADYLTVYAPDGADELGRWRQVRYESVHGDGLIARPMA
jgi:threonylcarbamoyladenosine tRNA methylthiotransferase MtaB